MCPSQEEQDSQWDASGLEKVPELSPWMRFRKGTLPGNMLAAAYRMRRAPLLALRSKRAARADGDTVVQQPPEVKGEYKAIYMVPAGPGDWAPLRDTLDSILYYEGDDTKVIVVDDSSTDCRRSVVQAEFPQVEVCRRRWPSCGPPNNYPVITDGIRFAMSQYSFEVLIKIDTDALVTGRSPSAAARELFERESQIGMAGTYEVRIDGAPESYEWDKWVLRQTERWSPSSRALMRRAREGGYEEAKVHGGIYAVSRRALETIESSGDLEWRSNWWGPLSEDFWLSMVVLANGFELGSLGGPGEAFAVASKYTPISKEQVLSDGVLAIHSVRRGLDAEDEESMRAFFREVRDESQAAPGRGLTTDSSLPPGR